MNVYSRDVFIFIFILTWRYEQISSAVKRNEHNVRLEQYREEIIGISQMSMLSMNIPVLHNLCRLLKYARLISTVFLAWKHERLLSRHEIDSFLLLIQSYVFICDYRYMDGIATLHHMHCVLKEWHDNIDNQQTTNHRFTLSSASALNFFKSPAKPALYTFYSKFHELLVAKVGSNMFDVSTIMLSVVFIVFLWNSLWIWRIRH
jgi:hypothetical protein